MSPVEGVEFAVNATFFFFEITHPLPCAVQCALRAVALSFGLFFVAAVGFTPHHVTSLSFVFRFFSKKGMSRVQVAQARSFPSGLNAT